MKALRFRQFGLENLNIEEVGKPQPGPGEVLVKVLAASINPSDVKNVQGLMRSSTTLPRIPGRDFAGVVEQGPENCINQEVWGCGGGELGFTRDGSHAEYVVVPEAAVLPKPKNLTFEQAAASALGVITAWAAVLDRAALKKGETLLVMGANGAVGSAAVQLGAWAGARVIGVDRKSGNKFGADVMLRSDSPTFSEELKSAAGQGVNVALDTVGGPMFQAALHSMARGGRLVVITVQSDTQTRLDLLNFYRNDLHLIGLNTLNLSARDSGSILQEAIRPFELEWLKPRELNTRLLSAGVQAYQEALKGSGKFVLVNG
ncbi:MAG TPA: zinc-binding alcohol dehydrogenase family protein [Terriglobales bacterium]|nr:zinc-binding alcohol dehydrogenase family protein [Terriglobales bacterium]